MGSELALSGLASGFDWQPVVEQLIELEAIPKKRLQLEKRQNDEKMSELGLLKGQLDTLKGAATALQNDDLFEARKGSLDEDAGKFMSANVKAGAMTGSYKIEVSLLGSSTSMSSIRRKPLGLGQALSSKATNFPVTGLDIKLEDLPLQTAITKGTFTVSSRTYEITNLEETLQELMDRIAADPEDDQTSVTLEYDAINDKIIVDGNDLITDPTFTDTPILGSPTDSSNFLKVLRLLDQISLNRDADYEGDSGISIWSGSSSSLANPEKAGWLRQDDNEEALAADDDKIFTANGIPTGKEVLYRRKAVHDQYEATKGYSTGNIVYRHGYLYEALQNFPTTAWTKTVDALNTKVSLSSLSPSADDFWQLKKDLATDRVGASTGQATFSAAVDTGGGPGQYHIPTASTAGTTALSNAYKAGDIVKAADGSFFRAVQDRKLANLTSTEDFGNIGQAIVTSKNANAGGWTTIAGVLGAPDEFRPNHIFVKGRIYEANTSGLATHFGSSNGFAEHDGVTGQVNFSGDDLVAGNAADAAVNMKFYRANAAWDNVTALPNTSTAHPTNWTAGEFVQADDNNFYEAHADWANVSTHSATTNYDPVVATSKYVHSGTGSTNFYEAHADWTAVDDFANGGSVNNIGATATDTNKYVFHTGHNKFYQAQQDLNLIAAKAETIIYNAAGTMAQKFAKSGTGAGTNFYKAKAAWANVTAYTEDTAVIGINTNDYRQLTSNGGANGRIYKALGNLGSFAAHATTANHTATDVVESGGNYWKAKLTTASQTFAGGGLTTAQVVPMNTNDRVLDTANGKVFSANATLQAIQNHAATTNYTNEVVAGVGGSFWKAQQTIASQTFGGGGLTTGQVVPMSTNDRVLDTANGKVFAANATLSAIQNHAATTNYTNEVVAGGGSFWQAQQTIAGQTFGAGGLSTAQVEPMSTNDRVLDTVNGKVFSATATLSAIQNHAATTNYTNEVVADGGSFWQAQQAIASQTFGAGGLTTAQVEPMSTNDRVLDTVNGKVFSATATLSAIQNHAATTNYTNEVVAGGGSFWQAQQALAEATFTSGGGISGANLGSIANADRVLNITQGKVYSALSSLGATASFAAGSSYASGTLIEDSGSYYKVSGGSTYAGASNTINGGNPAVNGAWVKGNVSGKFFQNASGGNLTTDPDSNPASWTDSGQTALASVVGSMVTDETTAVTKPTATNAYWSEETAATTLANNAYWANVDTDVKAPTATNAYWTQDTDATTLANNAYWANVDTAVKTPTATNAYWTQDTDATTLASNAYWANVDTAVKTPTATNTYWTQDTDATTLANNAYWANVDTDVKAPTATNTYWTQDTDATALAENAYWTEVTSAVTLNDQDTTAADTDYWEDVTTDIVNFPGGGTLTGGSIQDDFWEYVPEIAITTPLGAGVNDGYWQEVSSTLTDLTNTNWWTDASATLKDKSDAAWWTDKTATLNDLTNASWWGEVTTELTSPADAAFTNWWTEIAHANGDGVGEFDPLYWQQIKPGMTRVANNAVVANAVDHTIWKQVGNVQASAGNDGTFGNHDTGEAALRPTQAVPSYAGATVYSPGTILQASDSNFYKARVSTTNKDPALPANADDWALLGPTSSMTEDQAYGFTYTDQEFWKQNDMPTPGLTAGWENYWETLSETVLSSSQSLGSVSLTEKIADANFDGFAGANFNATGDVFYIGDGTGAVRIDYNVNEDTVADLIQRVNDSAANVTMYYDPVGDKFVVQNNADGAIGITLHERPLEAASTAQPDGVWDTLTANQATGNLLGLMGLAAPTTETDYTAFNNSATYTKGTYIKQTIGSTTTYWQALDDVPSGQTLDRTNSKWEQVARGVGRAANSELGNNYAIKINDGETIYNNTASFDETVHGYEGITFDVGGGAVGDQGTVKIERDSNPARNAIGKFVEEFNDAQDYIRSLVAVNQDGDNVTAGRFSSNIEISRLGSQLRKIVFGDSYVHSESKIAQDGTDLTVSTYALLTSVQSDLGLGGTDAGYQVKVKADESVGAHTIGDTTYYEWNGGAWAAYSPQFSSFRLADIGLDFGTGSDRLEMKDSSKLTEELLNNPDKVKALFAEATATANDKNTGTTNRQYQGVTFDLNDFLGNFLSGDSDSGYKGTYQAHADSIRAQNKRIDQRIEDLERYLEQREKALTQGFIRMEEMQSKISSQMQTLTNSFTSNSKK